MSNEIWTWQRTKLNWIYTGTNRYCIWRHHLNLRSEIKKKKKIWNEAISWEWPKINRMLIGITNFLEILFRHRTHLTKTWSFLLYIDIFDIAKMWHNGKITFDPILSADFFLFFDYFNVIGWDKNNLFSKSTFSKIYVQKKIDRFEMPLHTGANHQNGIHQTFDRQSKSKSLNLLPNQCVISTQVGLFNAWRHKLYHYLYK